MNIVIRGFGGGNLILKGYGPHAESFTLSADAGSFALTGQPVTFTRTYRLTCSAGSFTLTGQPATLTWSGALTEFAVFVDQYQATSRMRIDPYSATSHYL